MQQILLYLVNNTCKHSVMNQNEVPGGTQKITTLSHEK